MLDACILKWQKTIMKGEMRFLEEFPLLDPASQRTALAKLEASYRNYQTQADKFKRERNFPLWLGWAVAAKRTSLLHWLAVKVLEAEQWEAMEDLSQRVDKLLADPRVEIPDLPWDEDITRTVRL
jgi:hypothetical protein